MIKSESLSELDNPFWSSLQSRHRHLAAQVGKVVRYPAAYAPFFGVPKADDVAADVLESLIDPGERVHLLGVAPRVPAGWELKAEAELAQMICTLPLDVIDGPEMLPLSLDHRDDVLALTALVYPHYFRERTMELGRYFGIYQDGLLAAMIGERLGTETTQEISAICTHPDFIGRGYARRLTAILSNDIRERGRTPFLHVSYANSRAKLLYEQIGFHHHQDLGFWSLQRTAD